MKAGELFQYLRKKGQDIGLADTLIAATALTNRLPIKTLNIRHFSVVPGLDLL